MLANYVVEVTQEHIEKGVRGECGSCPLSLAFSELFNQRVFVGRVSFSFPDVKKPLPHFRLPKIAEEFIDNFDKGKPVQPFSVLIRIPTAYLDTILKI